VDSERFYAEDQACIHHERFGDLAAAAARRLVEELAAAGLRAGTVVDLGSGSGILARDAGAAGYDVEGTDLSPAMVDLARATAPAARFRVGSLHDAEFPPGTVGVVAVGETLNYATDGRAGLAALERLAVRARAALPPGGVLLFDVAGSGRHGGARHRVFVDAPTWSLSMEARESADGTRLDRAITIFASADGGDCYRRTDEHHVLRLYAPADVLAALTRAGFDARALPAYTSTPTASTPKAGWSVYLATAA
jgi:SAM-dependent methyltransferase